MGLGVGVGVRVRVRARVRVGVRVRVRARLEVAALPTGLGFFESTVVLVRVGFRERGATLG